MKLKLGPKGFAMEEIYNNFYQKLLLKSVSTTSSINNGGIDE